MQKFGGVTAKMMQGFEPAGEHCRLFFAKLTPVKGKCMWLPLVTLVQAGQLLMCKVLSLKEDAVGDALLRL